MQQNNNMQHNMSNYPTEMSSKGRLTIEKGAHENLEQAASMMAQL